MGDGDGVWDCNVEEMCLTREDKKKNSSGVRSTKLGYVIGGGPGACRDRGVTAK